MGLLSYFFLVMSARLFIRSAARVGARNTFQAYRPTIQTRYYSEPAESKSTLGLSSVVDHATGEEQELYEQYLTGPFGTIDKPVIVPSVFHTRIVGCVGGDGESAHDLLWHEVKKDKPTICIECGQVFQLKTDAASEVDPLDAVAGDSVVVDTGNITHVTNDDASFWESFEKFKKSHGRNKQSYHHSDYNPMK